MTNPWKTLKSNKVYENNWISVREDIVITPSKNEGIYGVVSPKSIATGVIALNEQNEIYLVGQYRYTTDNYSWEIIEGGSNSGESPIEAAKRELLEEAGLIAKDWKQIFGKIHLSNSISDEVAYLFIARDLFQTESSPEETEELTIKKVKIKAAMKMINDGEITDVLSILGITYIANLNLS